MKPTAAQPSMKLLTLMSMIYVVDLGLPSQKSWGKKKSAFYDADIVEEYAGWCFIQFYVVGNSSFVFIRSGGSDVYCSMV